MCTLAIADQQCLYSLSREAVHFRVSRHGQLAVPSVLALRALELSERCVATMHLPHRLIQFFTVIPAGHWRADPLFGWIEDQAAAGSLLSSLQRRLVALRIGGTVLAISFFALFIPWWSLDPQAPRPVRAPTLPPRCCRTRLQFTSRCCCVRHVVPCTMLQPHWLVGLHMLLCLSCYDAGLTWVCQAHNALLAELTADNQERCARPAAAAVAASRRRRAAAKS
eukprot:SAG11_NODE_109_length_16381_cov_48.316546_2_plen_223_part_00